MLTALHFFFTRFSTEPVLDAALGHRLIAMLCCVCISRRRNHSLLWRNCCRPRAAGMKELFLSFPNFFFAFVQHKKQTNTKLLFSVSNVDAYCLHFTVATRTMLEVHRVFFVSAYVLNLSHRNQHVGRRLAVCVDYFINRASAKFRTFRQFVIRFAVSPNWINLSYNMLSCPIFQCWNIVNVFAALDVLSFLSFFDVAEKLKFETGEPYSLPCQRKFNHFADSQGVVSCPPCSFVRR